jgi:hypothetical protein
VSAADAAWHGDRKRSVQVLLASKAMLREFSFFDPGESDMLKNSFLVSILLAAGAPACHHDRPVANPATAEAASSGMTATAEPGNPSAQNNSYSTGSPDNSSATSPGATVPGNPQLPETNDPDRTGSPQRPPASGAPTGNGTDTDRGVNGNPPDTTTPTSAKDAGSGANTGTGSGSNKARRTGSGTARGGSNGSGSSDGSAGSGSDVPR